MARTATDTTPKVCLDIGGPKGNAFYIMSTVRKLAATAGYDSNAIIKEMMAGDYDNLLRVYLKYFPFVWLYSNYKLGDVDESLYECVTDRIEL